MILCTLHGPFLNCKHCHVHDDAAIVEFYKARCACIYTVSLTEMRIQNMRTQDTNCSHRIAIKYNVHTR